MICCGVIYATAVRSEIHLESAERLGGERAPSCHVYAHALLGSFKKISFYSSVLKELVGSISFLENLQRSPKALEDYLRERLQENYTPATLSDFNDVLASIKKKKQKYIDDQSRIEQAFKIFDKRLSDLKRHCYPRDKENFVPYHPILQKSSFGGSFTLACFPDMWEQMEKDFLWNLRQSFREQIVLSALAHELSDDSRLETLYRTGSYQGSFNDQLINANYTQFVPSCFTREEGSMRRALPQVVRVGGSRANIHDIYIKL